MVGADEIGFPFVDRLRGGDVESLASGAAAGALEPPVRAAREPLVPALAAPDDLLPALAVDEELWGAALALVVVGGDADFPVIFPQSA